MAEQPRRPTTTLTLAEIVRDPRLYGILLGHAYLGIRVQFILRAALVGFLAATVVLVPPAEHRAGCYVVVALYAGWSAAAFVLSQRGGVRLPMIWFTLATDVVALIVLCLLASTSEQTWTTDVLVNGFFLIPMMATTELRPAVGAAVTTPTVAAYLTALLVAQDANSEPTAAIVLSTLVLAGLSVGCVALSWVQRSRVLTIAGLIHDRSDLMGELVDVERSARRGLAEELHDGALQYVLAARQDLEDARRLDDPTSFDRVDYALRESATLLRAKVSQLHPAVLDQVGLRRALADLCATTERSGAEVKFNSDGWSHNEPTPLDDQIYSAAREFLSNISRHAHAHHVEVTLSNDDHWARLLIADDGLGIEPGTLERRLSEGHVGLASQRTRIEAVGGRMMIAPGNPGTVIELALPAGVETPVPSLNAALPQPRPEPDR